MADKVATCNCLIGTASTDAQGNCICTGGIEPNSSTIVVPRRGVIDTTPMQTYYTQGSAGDFDLFEWIKGNKWIVIGGLAALLALFLYSKGTFSDK